MCKCFHHKTCVEGLVVRDAPHLPYTTSRADLTLPTLHHPADLTYHTYLVGPADLTYPTCMAPTWPTLPTLSIVPAQPTTTCEMNASGLLSSLHKETLYFLKRKEHLYRQYTQANFTRGGTLHSSHTSRRAYLFTCPTYRRCRLTYVPTHQHTYAPTHSLT